jgi:hypothetical protein
MTNKRVRYCLWRLINDRKSFITTNITDAEHIEIYKEDIEALQAAIEAIDMSTGKKEESKAEPSTTAPDGVNHPSHYETNGIECIDAMKATQGVDAVRDFCICNAFKYIWRHRRKNGAEDIKKAVWYLNKWLEFEGRNKNDDEEA